MIIDGKAIRDEIKDALAVKVGSIPPEDRPTLFIVMAGANAVTKNFVAIKKRFAEALGIPVEEKIFDDAELPATASLVRAVEEIVARGKKGGIVVQIPLPPGIDTQTVLNAVPPQYDIDVLGDESLRLFREGQLAIFPPVVGAIREILERNSIFLHGKKVAVLGQGRLVGVPVAAWFRKMEADVAVFDSTHPPKPEELQQLQQMQLPTGQPVQAAEPKPEDKDKIHVLILVDDSDSRTMSKLELKDKLTAIIQSIGKPSFSTPDMVRDGAIVLDAGTSEAGGKIVGDASPEAAKKCALFTPVPGGIGPVTIAILLQNLLTLATL
ncbi:MAG: bifunctional 5,10-methylenetetrahydrofolate dehydrogenase/5,10-methenyltetrahydrofolate cyclohydrolase [Parcubacteria group bacterium]|nr:bifunctional 5,10-methylenetetrahydrofolate dehydrogenase/5,10-methenyltetrahydrofolate cyclohydrolase [Parcubacteria group bacterium]